VLIALAILSMAIVVSIQGFRVGLRLLKLSGAAPGGDAHRRSQGARDQSPTQAGRDSGTEGAFTWEREVKQVARPTRRGRPRR